MKKGFDRLKGVAAASAMSLGVLGAGVGSVRAAPVTTANSTGSNSYRILLNNSIMWGGAVSAASGVANAASGTSSTGYWISGLGNLTWMGPTSTTTGGFAVKSAASVTNSGVADFTNFGVAEGGLFSIVAKTTDSASAATVNPGFLSDAFDQVLTWAVDGYLYKNPDATADLTDNLLSAGIMTNIVAGVDAKASLYFHPTRGVVRSVMALTNTSGSPVMTRATVMGNMGSDGSTLLQGSSNSDVVNDDADLWVVSSDTGLGNDAEDGRDPIITTTRSGTGASVTPTVSADRLGVGNSDNYYYHYDLTIPAGDTVRLMAFHEMTTTVNGAVTGAADFETHEKAYAAGLLAGMTVTDLNQVVNYAALIDTDSDGAPDVTDAFPNDATETTDTDGDGVGDNADAFPNDATKTTAAASSSSDGLLGMSLPGLLAMLGMLPVLRLFRKTKR